VEVILSGHIIVTKAGTVAKVVDRSTNGRVLYVAYVAFGKPGGNLSPVLASSCRLATAEEIAGSPFAKEFHLPAPEKT
jgi:hypothetical protein